MNTTAGLFNHNTNNTTNNNNMGSTFVYYSPHPEGTAENSRHHGVFTPQPHPHSQLLQPGHAVMRSPSPYQSHAGGPLHAPQPMSQHRVPILGDVRPHPQLSVSAPLTPYGAPALGFGSPQMTPTTPALTHSCLSSPASVRNLPPTPVHEQCPEPFQVNIVDAGIRTGRKEACDDVLVANAEIEPGFNPVYLSNSPKDDFTKVELELPRSLLTPSPTPSPQSPFQLCPETVDPRALSLDFGNSSSGTVSPADIFGTPPSCSSPFSSPAFFSDSTLGDFSIDTATVAIAPEVTLWEDISVADSALLPPSKRQRTSLSLEDHYFTDDIEDLRTGLLTPDSLSFSLSQDSMSGFLLQEQTGPASAVSSEEQPQSGATESQSTVSQPQSDSSHQQPSGPMASGDENGIASASEDDAPPKRRGRKQSTTDDPSKPYGCQVCGVRFRRQEHLKRHIRSVHTKDRPFQCKDCGKLFSRSDNLTQHQRTHGAGAVVLGVRDPSLQEALGTPGFATNQDPGQLGAILYQAADAISTSSSSASESSADDKKNRKRKRDS